MGSAKDRRERRKRLAAGIERDHRLIAGATGTVWDGYGYSHGHHAHRLSRAIKGVTNVNVSNIRGEYYMRHGVPMYGSHVYTQVRGRFAPMRQAGTVDPYMAAGRDDWSVRQSEMRLATETRSYWVFPMGMGDLPSGNWLSYAQTPTWSRTPDYHAGREWRLAGVREDGRYADGTMPPDGPTYAGHMSLGPAPDKPTGW